IFALGTALTRYHIRGDIPAALCIVALKLCVLPFAMWLMMTQVIVVEESWTQVAVLLSCMPVGISVYVFSRRYESYETAVATAIVMSSLAAPFALSAIVALLRH